ncbi:MAG: phage tail fiber protein [Actinomycetota bacterium]
MASDLSTYLADKLVRAHYRGEAFTFPGTIHLAAYTTAPSKADAGGVEVSGGAYARLAVVCNTTNFTALGGGAVENTSALQWATATADWGVIVAIGIRDAATLGNLLQVKAVAKVVLNGDRLTLPAGFLDIAYLI